jgi:predicted component of type VI protein secretion system
MAQLVIETRDGTHTIALDRDRVSIGRLSYNDVVLPYPQISRQHAELRRIGGQWWIADLHSTNGLQINSRRIQEHALATGDRVVLAPGVSLRFVAAPEENAGATSQPAYDPAALAPNSRPDRAERAAAPVGPRDDPQSLRPTAGPAPGQSYLPLEALPAPRAPSSAFADDEAPWAPGADASGPPARLPRGAFRSPEPSASPFAAWSEPASGQPPVGGFALPRDPHSPESDPGNVNPFQGDALRPGRAGPPTSPAPKLLHVCQTCGQLTAPDAVYCQNCHHTIAHECATCRLSLLPIQDRCPRCHATNQHSVRRAHGGRGA